MDLGVDLQGHEEHGTFTFPTPSTCVMLKVVQSYADFGQSNSGNDGSFTQEISDPGIVEDEILLSQLSEMLLSQ